MKRNSVRLFKNSFITFGQNFKRMVDYQALEVIFQGFLVNLVQEVLAAAGDKLLGRIARRSLPVGEELSPEVGPLDGVLVGDEHLSFRRSSKAHS